MDLWITLLYLCFLVKESVDSKSSSLNAWIIRFYMFQGSQQRLIIEIDIIRNPLNKSLPSWGKPKTMASKALDFEIYVCNETRDISRYLDT